MFNSKQLVNNFTLCLRFLRKYATEVEPKTFREKKQYYGDLYPDKLLTKKMKTPDHMYIAKENTARNINKYLLPYFKQSGCDTILEMNPGNGVFTRRLLDNEDQFKKIILMEAMEYFMKNLEELHILYPDRVKVKHADFVNLWKLCFLDKEDDGLRTQELLHDVPSREWEEDANMLLFGVVGSYQFFKHLIASLIFQTGIFKLGRTEMYIIVPPPVYLHLTCSSDIGYMVYRANSILFQMLFEHRFITYLRRDDFLPTQVDYNLVKSNKLAKILSIDPEYLYLVKIVPRRDLYKYIARDELPSLWYFVKQNCISRRNRIIPNLEKWVPGCGPRLVVNRSKSIPSVPLYDDEDVGMLPKYSTRCSTISNRDFFPNINIFTQFGELTASQMLTLFSQFRQFPEYEECSFLASLENSMMRINSVGEPFVEEVGGDDDDLTIEEITGGKQISKHITKSTISYSTQTRTEALK